MSMTSKSITPRKIIQISVAGSPVERFEIVSVEDGRVTLKQFGRRTKGRGNARGRWWLDYQYVKDHGLLASVRP